MIDSRKKGILPVLSFDTSGAALVVTDIPKLDTLSCKSRS